MKRLLYYVYFCILLLMCTTSVRAAVVINEIFPKPSDEVSEWIELYNNGDDVLNLDGWKLENTNGDKKSFFFSAGNVIQPKSFITMFQAQTGISLNNGGDTVRLTDPQNNEVDSKNYPSTIGYNYSMGRGPDGGDSWVLCVAATYNATNNCPVPTSTPTPYPTSLPTVTPTNIIWPTDTPTPTIDLLTTLAKKGIPTSDDVQGITTDPTPTSIPVPLPTVTPYLQSNDYRTRWAVGLLAGVAIGCILFFYGIMRS